MKKSFLLCFYIFFEYCCFAQQAILFDDGWRFHRGDVQGAQETGFDDKAWRQIELPHDWSIEDLPGANSPFDPDAINGVSVGFTTGGTGWYRKTFTVPASSKNKIIYLQFDGVYMNADVWLNGAHLGNHPYGYTSFFYDVSSKIKRREQNVIAVQVKNEGATSRWYAGSGINRHVWLKMMAPQHAAQWGTYITAVDISKAAAKVNIQTQVQNESGEAASVQLITHLQNNRGTTVGSATAMQTINGNASAGFNQRIIVSSPVLWSTESPALYTAVTEVFADGKLMDRTQTVFGIRTIAYTIADGFLLNGKPLKLKGGCFHIDNGPLGAKAYDRAEERRVELMKESGFNAIRCSHNPPAPAFLDACDRLGMLVIDETFDMWNEGKNTNDYHLYFKDWWKRDVESMLLRDRNHPGIVMWSIGNEIPERATAEGVQTAKALTQYVKSFDTTRPVTAAVNGLNPDKDPFFATLDVSGYNYAAGGDHHQKNIYEQDHKRVPHRIMMGTESYPLAAFDAWMQVEDNPYVIGDFVWTAFDYIGEASIGWLGYMQEKSFYPWNLAYCGDIDICGWKRPQSYYRDALWKKDQLSLFVKPPEPSFPLNPKIESWSLWNWYDDVSSWNWQGNEGKPLEINVYSSCEEVELFLNGKSLGNQPTNRNEKFTAKFRVPYKAGTLQATGYTGNKQVATAALHTASEPVNIKLTADRSHIKADGEDLSYITVELLDKNGNRNPEAENEIQFSVQGAGTIAGVGNANPRSIESYQQPHRNAWQGRCLVIVKADKKKGTIVLKASGEGLQSSSITIAVK